VVELTIRDDGVGLDPETARRRAAPGESSGLLLKDRLARLGQAVSRALAYKCARDDQRLAEQTIARQAHELAQSEAVLRDQTRVLKSIFDSMGDGVVVADETGAFRSSQAFSLDKPGFSHYDLS
jgi:PAS domain-containing protein